MKRALFCGAILVLAYAGAANADTATFTLTDCNSSSGCSPQFGNNFGTVTITDVSGGGGVTVNVHLGAGYTWANTGLSGSAFTLASGFAGGTPTVSGVSANWNPSSGLICSTTTGSQDCAPTGGGNAGKEDG